MSAPWTTCPWPTSWHPQAQQAPGRRHGPAVLLPRQHHVHGRQRHRHPGLQPQRVLPRLRLSRSSATSSVAASRRATSTPTSPGAPTSSRTAVRDARWRLTGSFTPTTTAFGDATAAGGVRVQRGRQDELHRDGRAGLHPDQPEGGSGGLVFLDDYNNLTFTMDANKLLVPTPPRGRGRRPHRQRFHNVGVASGIIELL